MGNDNEVRLIDANALKESLKKLKAEGYNQKYVQGLQDAIDGYFPQIIDDAPTIEDKPLNTWISVDDKLPEESYDCLVWYSCNTPFGKSESVGISFCSRCDWYTKHLDGDNIVVLYWQPLPEAPKEEK